VPSVVATPGTATASLPSLGVAAASVIGKDVPPSVERRMSTAAQLTGAAVVLATFQATTSTVPWIQVTGVSGAVTLKGPAAETTFTTAMSDATPPPPARLSRMVARNCMDRVVIGKDSLTGTSGGVLSKSRM
jgi:hypothetical protein